MFTNTREKFLFQIGTIKRLNGTQKKFLFQIGTIKSPDNHHSKPNEEERFYPDW